VQRVLLRSIHSERLPRLEKVTNVAEEKKTEKCSKNQSKSRPKHNTDIRCHSDVPVDPDAATLPPGPHPPLRPPYTSTRILLLTLYAAARLSTTAKAPTRSSSPPLFHRLPVRITASMLACHSRPREIGVRFSDRKLAEELVGFAFYRCKVRGRPGRCRAAGDVEEREGEALSAVGYHVKPCAV
jgi:hypothetical protein